MYYLKNKYFHCWAKKHGITDKTLFDAIEEFENGLFEANLGNHLYKKRIALPGKGKSGGTRTILFYQQGRRVIFCFGFEKNQQANLTSKEEKFLKKFSELYQGSTDENILLDIKHGLLVEIIRTEE